MFRLTYKAGYEYEGKVKTRMNKSVVPEGYGVLSDRYKNVIYTGEWKKGVFNG